MHMVVLDGYTENPGDLSWSALEALGELTVYDRTSLTDEGEIIRRIHRGEEGSETLKQIFFEATAEEE